MTIRDIDLQEKPGSGGKCYRLVEGGQILGEVACVPRLRLWSVFVRGVYFENGLPVQRATQHPTTTESTMGDALLLAVKLIYRYIPEAKDHEAT